MRAIILAAGESKRLKEYTKDTPKCLLDVGGMTMLGRQLLTVRNLGITDITVVTGFCKEKIESYLKTHTGAYVKTINNPIWKETNNSHSLYLGIGEDTSPFILLNADVVCHPDLVKTVMYSKYDNALGVQRKRKWDAEEMKVVFNTQLQVAVISKVVDTMTETPFEFTGIGKINHRVKDIRAALQNYKTQWFENCFNDLIYNKKVAFHIEDVTSFPSIEIDFPKDLEEARDIFPSGQPDWEQGIRHDSLLKGERNIQDAIMLLNDTVSVLEGFKVRYWLNWGLLLGAVRDGQPIPWDTDLDVTCHWEQRDIVLTEVEPRLKTLGCFIPKQEVCYPEDRWYIRDKEKIELNFVEKVGNRYVYSPNRCKLGCPAEYIDKLDTVHMMGNDYNIPSNVSKYLELSYGSNWRTPIKGKKPVSL